MLLRPLPAQQHKPNEMTLHQETQAILEPANHTTHPAKEGTTVTTPVGQTPLNRSQSLHFERLTQSLGKFSRSPRDFFSLKPSPPSFSFVSSSRKSSTAAAPEAPETGIVQLLLAKLKEKEADAVLAAEIGQHLLREVETLKRRLIETETKQSASMRLGETLKRRLTHSDAPALNHRGMNGNWRPGIVTASDADDESSDEEVGEAGGLPALDEAIFDVGKCNNNGPDISDDMAFAAEIGQSLLMQMRALQTRFAALEEEKTILSERLAEAERETETAHSALSRKENSNVDEHVWTLELQVQELQSQISEQQKILTKSTNENQRQTIQLASLTEQVELLKANEDRLSQTAEYFRTKYTRETCTLKKTLAHMTNENKDVVRSNDELQEEVNLSKKSEAWKGDLGGYLQRYNSQSTRSMGTDAHPRNEDLSQISMDPTMTSATALPTELDMNSTATVISTGMLLDKDINESEVIGKSKSDGENLAKMNHLKEDELLNGEIPAVEQEQGWSTHSPEDTADPSIMPPWKTFVSPVIRPANRLLFEELTAGISQQGFGYVSEATNPPAFTDCSVQTLDAPHLMDVGTMTAEGEVDIATEYSLRPPENTLSITDTCPATPTQCETVPFVTKDVKVVPLPNANTGSPENARLHPRLPVESPHFDQHKGFALSKRAADGDAKNIKLVNLDERLSLLASSPPGDHLSADSETISSITETMIGELLYKYTRKRMGGGKISENRHLRFFWVHPYTRTLYWRRVEPSMMCDFGTGPQVAHNMAAHGGEEKAKSAYITSVRAVDSFGPNGKEHSILLRTRERELKIMASTLARHKVWIKALSFLVHRTNTNPKGLGERAVGRSSESSSMETLEADVGNVPRPGSSLGRTSLFGRRLYGTGGLGGSPIAVRKASHSSKPQEQQAFSSMTTNRQGEGPTAADLPSYGGKSAAVSLTTAVGTFNSSSSESVARRLLREAVDTSNSDEPTASEPLTRGDSVSHPSRNSPLFFTPLSHKHLHRTKSSTVTTPSIRRSESFTDKAGRLINVLRGTPITQTPNTVFDSVEEGADDASRMQPTSSTSSSPKTSVTTAGGAPATRIFANFRPPPPSPVDKARQSSTKANGADRGRERRRTVGGVHSSNSADPEPVVSGANRRKRPL